MTSPFPLEQPEILDNPFPFFRECRKNSPILFHEPWKGWFIFLHDDISALTRERRLSNQRMGNFAQSAPPALREAMQFLQGDLSRALVMLDDPEHRRVRQIMQQSFTPQAVARLEPKIRQRAEELISRFIGRSDISMDLCRELPLWVLADLMDFPEEDYHRLAHWARDFVEYFNRLPAPEDVTRNLLRSAAEMIEYSKALIAERRSHPGDDLISLLIHGEADGKRLTESQVLANVVLILIAGNDTVGSALGNAVYLLLTHPEQAAKAKSGEIGWAGVFEEVMRYEPANPIIRRRVMESFEYKGHAISVDHEVFLVLASGSRDEAHFDDPDSFDISREAGRQMGFGYGAHYCVGAALARAEAQILLPLIWEKLPNLQLDAGRAPVWLRTLGVRGPTVLPVRYDGN